MDLSIIILNHNTKNLLKECLRGIRYAAPALSLETIVVDNASSDGSAEMVLREFPETRLIRAPKNRGYAAGNNIGIRAAGGKYFMIMNPDILVRPGSLESLVAYFESHPNVGLLGPRLENPDGSVQQSCFRFHGPMTPIYRRTFLGQLSVGRRALSEFLMADFNHQSERDVDWLLGGAIMARAAAVAEVGPMDESFFLYFDDTDWCRRFWEKSWRVVYLPESAMIHFHQRASAGGLLELLKNPTARIHLLSALRYFNKYQGKPNPHAHPSSHH